MTLSKFYVNKEVPKRVIKVSSRTKLGFAVISVNNHKGMNQIRVDMLNKEYDECSEEYFNQHKKYKKDK